MRYTAIWLVYPLSVTRFFYKQQKAYILLYFLTVYSIAHFLLKTRKFKFRGSEPEWKYEEKNKIYLDSPTLCHDRLLLLPLPSCTYFGIYFQTCWGPWKNIPPGNANPLFCRCQIHNELRVIPVLRRLCQSCVSPIVQHGGRVFPLPVLHLYHLLLFKRGRRKRAHIPTVCRPSCVALGIMDTNHLFSHRNKRLNHTTWIILYFFSFLKPAPTLTANPNPAKFSLTEP